MKYEIKEAGRFKYIETGGGEDNLLLLHGLFGALSNFEGIIDHFSETHNVVVPILPIFELPIRKVSVTGLVNYVADFVDHKGYEKVHVLGNSLGGHIALLYVQYESSHIFLY
jgi:2-hydroxy-6-oxonona-2,4-dienedioate hydrolase